MSEIDYEKLRAEAQETYSRMIRNYEDLAIRARRAYARAMLGEPGETLESVLNEYGKQLRKELDDYSKSGTIGEPPPRSVPGAGGTS